MRDMVRCLSEHAVRVSETSCSSNVVAAAASSSTVSPSPAVQNAVVSVYRARLKSSQKTLFITVTWCRTQAGHQGGGLIIDCGNSNSVKLNTFSRLFRKNKGQKSFPSDSSSSVDVFWDLSGANYYPHTGPEPIDGYYILVSVGADVALALGDLAQEAASKRRLQVPTAGPPSTLVSRREHYSSGGALHCATRAQFRQSAVTHDIVVSCSLPKQQQQQHRLLPQQQQQPVLQVSIDKRVVINVRRLQWNFRGNQTVFVDGLLVDLMWDVHDWFFKEEVNGFAVFMFKIRSGGESSRLWLEDNFVHKNHDDHHNNDDADIHDLDFSLLLYASKNP